MRKLTDDRVATDPHGFAPVPPEAEPGVPRQRARGPSHEAWDPAYEQDPRPRAGLGDTPPYGEAPPRYAAAPSGERPRRRPRRPAGGSGTDTRQFREDDGAPRAPRSRSRSRAAVVDDPRVAGTGTAVQDVAGPRIATIAIPVAIGTLVAVGIGVWARTQDPTGVAVNLAGFSSAGAVKTWLASLALVLALAQGWTGMVMRGRIGAGATPLVATLHRWTGRLAVLVTVPVAVQCLIALGWSGATTRTLVHSVLGCVFYGAFVTKMLLLRRSGVPGWVVAVSGGLLLAVLTGIWLTSALWFFGTHGLSF